MKYLIVSRQRTDDECNLNDDCRSFLFASSQVSIIILKNFLHYSCTLPTASWYWIPARGKVCLGFGKPGTDIEKKESKGTKIPSILHMPRHNRHDQSQFFCCLLLLENQLNMQHSFEQDQHKHHAGGTPMSESAAPLERATATDRFIPRIDLHLCLKLSINSVAAH